MNDRRTALTYARRFRKCPPAGIRSISRERESVARHEAGCPLCGDLDIAEDCQWDDLARRIGAESPKTEISPPLLQPGDLCRMRPALGRWVEEAYFTPPLVMVLDADSRLSDEIQVAQVYHDTVMAGPGDLILTDDQSGVGELFVEPWNRYTLRKRDLENPVATLGAEILRAVVALADDSAAYPSWAMRPRPLKAEDPRGYFRDMEIEVGYVFASRAVSQLVNTLEKGGPLYAYDTPLQLVRDLQNQHVTLRFPSNPSNILDVITGATFDEAALPMAADTGKGKSLTAMAFIVENGCVSAVHPIPVSVYHTHPETEHHTCSGQIGPLDPDLILHTAFFNLLAPDGVLIRSSHEAVDIDSGVFTVRFPLPPREEATLRVTLICSRREP